MNGDFIFDVDNMKQSIDRSDAVSIFFPSFGKALVVDPRSNDERGPMVRIMPMAASPQERLRSIRRHRPGFPRVRNLAVIPWTRYVDSLVRLGIWDALAERLRGEPDALNDCKRALDELRRMEQREIVNAVTGKDYHTLWAARG